MIPVTPADEPADFDARVRRPGLAAIAELVGENPGVVRRGPKRKKIAATREEISADDFPPLWRSVLPQLLASYGRICAYLALYIEPATGDPSVDHFVPKSQSWRRVYEWSNYRLAAALINSKKKDTPLALDPFTLSPGLFGLEFVAFQITVGPAASGALKQQVEDTITLLGLNLPECCKARGEYVTNYEVGPDRGGIGFPYLEHRAPFIASELRRQGLLRRGDV